MAYGARRAPTSRARIGCPAIRNNVMIIWSGYYADTLVKTDGTWLIQEQVGRAWEGPVVSQAEQARASSLTTT